MATWRLPGGLRKTRYGFGGVDSLTTSECRFLSRICQKSLADEERPTLADQRRQRYSSGMKGQGFQRRFGYARNGIITAFRRERSMRTHGVALIGAFGFLAVTAAPPLWWALVALAAGMVIVAEMANTAVEALADLLHPGQHPEIGVAKDVAAGAVLVASGVALVVGAAYLYVLVIG